MKYLFVQTMRTTGAAIQAVPMTLSSGLDLKAIYRPPSTLQLPGGAGPAYELNEAALSQAESMSSSSSQSSIGSTHGIQTDLVAEVTVSSSSKPKEPSEVHSIVNKK